MFRSFRWSHPRSAHGPSQKETCIIGVGDGMRMIVCPFGAGDIIHSVDAHSEDGCTMAG